MYEFLQILWFLLIAVLLLGYFILGGFDLGAGILYPFIAKNQKDKTFVRRAIGPFWDGNEVWLLTGGGALFAAFAPAYATSFSGFYLAIMLVLFGLIMRAVSVEMVSHDKKWRKFWEVSFFVGSLVPALLFGAAIGNVIQGVALDAAGEYRGGFFSLLNPFALLCGVMGLVAIMTQGAAWLALKAPIGSDIHTRAVKMRSRLNIGEFAAFALAGAYFLLFVMPQFGEDRVAMPLAFVFAGLCVVGWFVARFFFSKKNDLMSFLAVNLVPICLIGLTAASLYPNLIPAAANPQGVITYFLIPGAAMPELSLTIFNSSNSELTLTIMLIITSIGLPLVLTYHVILYRIFRGRIKDDQLNEVY
ncbi:MAG: cytochrome d ubiquinol oxidase subunit II [Coriobacteriales bacterium]|jgi:cytochrome d ubiquinol oxidase subunit II|nr:cytochrome d ubiquinol oxidase subunit II [Coriobacteriales bacterium]